MVALLRNYCSDHTPCDSDWVLSNVNVLNFGELRPSIMYSRFVFLCFLWEKLTPGSSDGKEAAYNAGDPRSILGLGRSPGEGNGNPLQYSCLENPMDRGAWWATVHRVAKSWTRVKQFITRCSSGREPGMSYESIASGSSPAILQVGIFRE